MSAMNTVIERTQDWASPPQIASLQAADAAARFPAAIAAIAAEHRPSRMPFFKHYASLPREESTTVLEGYWVYLESPPTEAGERRLLERLRRGGIADAQAVGDLGAARRISLGVFSDEARAAAQSERVAKLQLLPQIEAREKPATAIWLDLTLKSDAPPLEGQKFPAGDAELEFRPCPAVAVSAGAPVAQSPAAQ